MAGPCRSRRACLTAQYTVPLVLALCRATANRNELERSYDAKTGWRGDAGAQRVVIARAPGAQKGV
jgi:hypothetical protein